MLILCILGAAIDLENKYKPEHNLTQNWTHIAHNSSIEIPTCIFTIITFNFWKLEYFITPLTFIFLAYCHLSKKKKKLFFKKQIP